MVTISYLLLIEVVQPFDQLMAHHELLTYKLAKNLAILKLKH